MRPRPTRRTHGLAIRLAIGATASLAVVASSATGAMAEEATPSDEPDPSTVVLDTEVAEPPVEGEPPAGESETPESEGPDTEVTETEVDGDAAETAPVDEGGGEVGQPSAIAPQYGTQKVRIGIQQADGSYLDPEATLVGTMMSITITGGVDAEGDPLASETTSCVVDTESGDATSRSADCEVGDDFYLYLDAGRTATITPTVVPTGVVLAPASRVVQPCLVDDCVAFPGNSRVDFSATGTPVAVSAATTAGQPVTIDVVTPLDLAPDNAVTGVTVTSQSADGTAVVTGDLPPVPDEPVVPDGATGPVAEAAPAGSSRIVFTPNAGFAGTTSFGYAVATQNGTITGAATVTVAPAPVVTPPVVAPPAAPAGAGNVGTSNRVRSRAADGTLPSTGGPAEELLAVGALLVVAGAGAMAARRRTERDLVG